MGKTSEFQQALAHEASFFPMLFALRDSDAPAVVDLAHQIASHWADEFFGWAWECCALCKRVAAKLMLAKQKNRDAEAAERSFADVASALGTDGMLRGLRARLAQVGVIVTIQLVLYDTLKHAFGVP